ncbi:MAG: S-methyl-5-thioribose-1-phosphate isomerase [Deltaproteobacteria bacterium]|nr:S-methyl-5-thioribose-1-phosphate isomerase [Deltaproteobacteria bacterium]MCB9785565.1 S-methyl-5-thioribose-1-phosphate isomerase [Deltaproteobacteria bacterium]
MKPQAQPSIHPLWRDAQGRVVMIDQTLLPHQEVHHVCASAEDTARAIETMVVRGAPAIGVAAAMGIALGASQLADAELAEGLAGLYARMARTRPTAVNLFWAIDRMRAAAEAHQGTPGALRDLLDREAQAIFDEDFLANQAMGDHGAALVPDGARILTHCNAGALATAGWGTALGVIRSAVREGKRVHVYADETRPFLQGSRLTAWELMRDEIPVTLLADNAAGHLIASGGIDLAIVGTDRTVLNGDVANKIGTYQVAVLCHRHGIPFYVAAPTSTLDLTLEDGRAIPIEERAADEVRTAMGHPIAPTDVPVYNPSFDVTPAELVSAIITEQGIARAPYARSLPPLAEAGRRARLRA